MAKYDHGGGCACGLRLECNCGSSPSRSALAMPSAAAKVVDAARELLADIRRRHPGEALYCQHIAALDKAVAAFDAAYPERKR